MKKQILTLILSVLPTFAFAAGGGAHLDSAPIDISDMDSVKRGAKHFIDYCFSCHEASYMRYNRIARDTGMTDAELREELIFTTNEKGEPTKVGSLMMFFATPDERVGYVKQNGNDYSYVVASDSTQREQIVELFDALQKQIRTGYFTLPNALLLRGAN